MGFGLPASIGAALACPDRKVVCFSGDGSLMMNIQELATAAEQDVDITIVLMDNNSLGLVHQQQDLFYGGRIYECTYRTQADFIKIAAGFDMRAIDLGTSADPMTALAQAFEKPGPCLIRAQIERSAKVYPMVPPGAANKIMIGGESSACAIL